MENPRASTRSHWARVNARTMTGNSRGVLAVMRSLVVKRVTRAVASFEPLCGFRSVSNESLAKIAGLAVLLVAAQGAVILAVGSQHAAHEQALAHLRRAIHGGGHRHARRAIQIRCLAAQPRQLEFVGVGNRSDVPLDALRIVGRRPMRQVVGERFGRSAERCNSRSRSSGKPTSACF